MHFHSTKTEKFCSFDSASKSMVFWGSHNIGSSNTPEGTPEDLYTSGTPEDQIFC